MSGRIFKKMTSKICIIICLIASAALSSVSAQDTRIVLITPDSNKTELRLNYDNIIQISPLPRRAKFSINGSPPSFASALQPIDNDKYIYRIDRRTSYSRVKIDVWYEGAILTSKTFGFSVLGPEVWVAGSRYDTVSMANLRSNPVVEVYHNGRQCEVLRFEFTAAPKRGEFVGPFRNEGARLNHPDVSMYLLRASAGDKIFIEDIETRCAEAGRFYAFPKLQAVIRITR